MGSGVAGTKRTITYSQQESFFRQYHTHLTVKINPSFCYELREQNKPRVVLTVRFCFSLNEESPLKSARTEQCLLLPPAYQRFCARQ